MSRRIIETREDLLENTVTFELDDGNRICIDAREARSPDMTKWLASMEIVRSSEPVDVIQYGRKVGELPAFWHPGIGKSSHWLYDFRRGDLTLVDGKWIAARNLGASDLDYLIGFVRKG